LVFRERWVTSEPRPAALSVVVPSVNGWGELRGCLEALEAARAEADLEILVPDRMGKATREAIASEFPKVRIIAAGAGTTIPQLRAMAFEQASGAAVAVIEDHVLVPKGWVRAVMNCLADGEDVIGGAVENAATERIVDWAAFLCEYHHLLPPIQAGPVDRLTGNNTVYRRSVLARYEEAWRAGQWEDHLHAALRAGGVTLYQHPEIVVRHRMPYSVGEYLDQRFLFSRAWAGMRAVKASLSARVMRGAAAALLPPMLFWRVVRTVWRKKVYRHELLRALPLIALFTLAWGAGEMVGYWFGAGDALARVR
jgi:hypothetical protein